MKIFLRIFLVLILIFNSSLVHAISPNPIIKGFKALKGLFSKSADELPDIGKRLEDFKNVKNSDNTINPSIIDEIDNIKHNEARTLSEFENLMVNRGQTSSERICYKSQLNLTILSQNRGQIHFDIKFRFDFTLTKLEGNPIRSNLTQT